MATRSTGLDEAAGAGALVFHAGTAVDADGTIRTAGGRVLTVVGRGPDLAAARDQRGAAADADRAATGLQRRHDIGATIRRDAVRRRCGPMIRRYTLPEMGAIWSEQARFEAMLRVELAVARAQAAAARSRPTALAALETRARVDVERIAEIERTTDHDVIAFVSQVAETVGPEGPLPAPRPDQQRRRRHRRSRSSSAPPASACSTTPTGCSRRSSPAPAPRRRRVMMGRTHSVHAEPTTLGLKLAGWAFEVDRGRTRLAAAVDEIGTGKISGPVGTYSHLGPDIEAEVLAALGLHVDPVSTQIVQRDRHAALLAAIAILGGSLERFATEIRNLQHTEIGELQEPFKAGQKGSTAMPHKRNPILSERIAGLARLLRGYAHTALEDQPLWHERDISHSQRRAGHPARRDDPARLHAGQDDRAHRGPRSSAPSGCARTSRAGSGCTRQSRVLVALVEDGGLSREEAYAIVQRAALRAADERAPLRDLLAVDPAVAQRLSLDAARRVLRRRGVPAPRPRGHRPARPASRRRSPPGARPRHGDVPDAG